MFYTGKVKKSGKFCADLFSCAVGQPTGPGGMMAPQQQQQPLFPAAAAAQGNQQLRPSKLIQSKFFHIFQIRSKALGLSEVKHENKR
jgi:hypothetical protein